MAAENTPKRLTPPYATRAGLELFFAKIKTIKPSVLTTKWAEDHELPFADAIVNTMKFLKAANKDGSLTPEFSKLRLDGAQSEETLATLVRDAYQPIFDQVDDISTVSVSDLKNAFKSTYDVGSPGRYVLPFLTLCELAGLRGASASLEPQPRPRSRQPRGATTTTKVADRPMREPEIVNTSRYRSQSFQVIVRMDIPWDASIDEIRSRIEAIRSITDAVDA